MILCNDCGEQNEDGTVFCARCGVFLEWEGERVTEPATATLLPETAASSDHPGPSVAQATYPAASVVHPGPDAPRPDRQPVVPIHPHTTQLAPSGLPTSTDRENHQPPPAQRSAEQAGAGLGAPAVDGPTSRQPQSQQPQSRQPQSRQPQTVKRRMPRRSKSPVVVPTGSRICGGCGMPNEATRRFCAKCGFSLVDAKIVRKTPWWRRLLGRERVYAAGTRLRPSGARRRFQGATRLVALLAVLGGAGILAGPQRGLVMDGVHWVQNAVSDPIPVRPESPKASGAVGRQTATLAFDGARNTYWAAPRAGRTARPVPVLIGTFPKPVKLVRFGIWPGVSDQTPKFVAGPRPAEIELTVNTGTGPIVKRFPIKDTPTFQQFDFKADDVRTFHLAVTKTTRPTRAILTAISEVEFFAHR